MAHRGGRRGKPRGGARPARLVTGLLVSVGLLVLAPTASAAPGDLDPSFGTGGVARTDFGIGREEYGVDVAVDAAGRTVVVGNAETPSVDESSMAIARYTPSGALDPTFGGGDGRLLLNLSPGDQDSAGAVATDANGRIVVVGTTREFLDTVVVRLTGTGQLDPSFGGGDGVTTLPAGSARLSDVTVDPEGRIVAAGGIGDDMAVLRLMPDGSLDTSFSGDGIATVGFGASQSYAGGVALDGSGRIAIAGQVGQEGEADYGAARLLNSGTPDTSFSGDGRVATDVGSLGNLDFASGMAVDSGNRIVVVGSSVPPSFSEPLHLALVRYAANGALDPTFGDEGVVLAAGDSTGRDVAIDASGRLLVVGYADESLADVLRRLQVDGSLDSTFGGGDGIAPVPFGIAEAVALDPMRRIMVAGSDWNGSDSDFAAARFVSGEPAPPVRSLSVSLSGSGSGGVTGPGISCPGDCTQSYAHGTAVALIASPAAGSAFAGWSGDCAGTGGCQVTMDAAKAVTASFDLIAAGPPSNEPPVTPPATMPAPGSPSQPDASPGPRIGRAAAARVAPVKGGSAFVRLRCGGGALCRGVAKLLARVRSRGKARRSARRTRNVVLGRSRFRIPAGQTRVVRIRLNRKGRLLLRRAGHRGLRARLVGRGLRNRVVRLKPRHGRGKRSGARPWR